MPCEDPYFCPFPQMCCPRGGCVEQVRSRSAAGQSVCSFNARLAPHLFRKQNNTALNVAHIRTDPLSILAVAHVTSDFPAYTLIFVEISPWQRELSNLQSIILGYLHTLVRGQGGGASSQAIGTEKRFCTDVCHR